MADKTRSGGAVQDEPQEHSSDRGRDGGGERAHLRRGAADEELLVTGSPAAVALGMLYIDAAAASSILIMDALQQQRHGAMLQMAVTCTAVERLLDGRYLDRAFDVALGASPSRRSGE